MENHTVKHPLYAKMAFIIVGLLAFFYIMYIGQEILIPLAFSLLLAILLNPMVGRMEKKGMNRVIAILLAILLAFAVAAGILYFIGSQLSMFSDAAPAFKQKFSLIVTETSNWIHEKFNVPKRDITAWIAKTKKNGLDSAGTVIHTTILTISSILVVIFLLPVYVFMFIFYKPLLLDFVGQLFKSKEQAKVEEVLSETKGLIQNYLIGLMLEAGVVAVLNSVGLLIIGIDYAILFGVIGALLNVIPYIGGIVAIALPMLMAIATKSFSSALLVLAVYGAVQFIDNNIIVPRIVASKVKINALVSIVVVLIGGALWGVSGMFLAIPITAILKVIFDRVLPLKPFGYLIGDTMPTLPDYVMRKSRRNKKPKQ